MMELTWSGWSGWSSVMLLLLPAGLLAQSGDADQELRISCTSHISTRGSSLTCQLLPCGDQDQDQEDTNRIQRICLCYTEWAEQQSSKCLEDQGNTITSPDLNLLHHHNLTVYLKGGGWLETVVDLKKIVRPRSPVVWNVTFDLAADQMLVIIWTPYQNDYLTDNQMFQVHISNSSTHMTLNVSSRHLVSVHLKQLKPSSGYQIRVRAIPHHFLEGSWSPWSRTVHFTCPATGGGSGVPRYLVEVMVCLVVVVVVVSSVVVQQRNRICHHMWPRVPHPKHTLLHVYTLGARNPPLLQRLQPDVFNALIVFSQDKKESAGGASPPHHTDLLSWSYSSSRSIIEEVEEEEQKVEEEDDKEEEEEEEEEDEEEEDQVTQLIPDNRQQEEEMEVQEEVQEEAYVTMSSFYRQK